MFRRESTKHAVCRTQKCSKFCGKLGKSSNKILEMLRGVVRGTEFRRENCKEDLAMRKVSAKMVPGILTDGQKQRRLVILSYISFYLDIFE